MRSILGGEEEERGALGSLRLGYHASLVTFFFEFSSDSKPFVEGTMLVRLLFLVVVRYCIDFRSFVPSS